jgi:acetyl esterase
MPRLPPTVERRVTRALLQLPAPALRRLAGPLSRSPEGFELDVQIQALLRLERFAKQPALHEGSLAEARARLDRLGPLLDVTGVRDVVAADRHVDGGSGKLAARVYTPSDARKPRGALVWFHGGGFVLGSLDSQDGLCRAIASRSCVVVVSVDYRLAPEHPFPAAVEDAVAATRWVLAHASEIGVDATAIAVGGDSAGGNLSAVVAQSLRDDRLRPAFQLLVYPGTDMTRSFPSHKFFRDGFILTKADVDWFVGHYLPDANTHRDPRASPLFATDLSRLPPAWVITAGFDPLRDEGDAYAEKMRSSGVRVEHIRATSMTHGFIQTAGVVREAARTLDRMALSLSAALADRAAHTEAAHSTSSSSTGSALS